MMVFLKWTGLIAAVLVLVIVGATVAGALLPVKHVASRTQTFPVAQTRLWELVTAAFERMNDGSYAIVEQRPPNQLVTAIVDEKKPYGGTWTYELAPARGGTSLRVVENGEVYNPFFRFVSRYVIGHARTIDGYFADLQKAAGPAPTART